MGKDAKFIAHYGTPRHSGRYPWGSGKKYQRSRTFITTYKELKAQGKSDSKIAEEMGLKNTSQLRSRRAAAMEEAEYANVNFAEKLHEKGMSNIAIAERMNVTEGTVRNWLKKGANKAAKEKSIVNVSNILGEQINRKTYLDIGKANNLYLGISETKLKDALTMLTDKGYQTLYLKVPQLGTNHETNMKVMIPPGKDKKEAYAELREDISRIGSLDEIHFRENGHGTAKVLHDPVSIDMSRIKIRHSDEGGKLMDGVIELRPGVDDISLGKNRYAQVRILTNDGKSYLKGMAVYNYDMPEGVDIIYNSNKSSDKKPEQVFKETGPDPHNPFGTTIKTQNDWTDDKGVEHKGALNILREEGDWDTWSKNLPSQFLSKQPVSTAKKQLDIAALQKEKEYEDIRNVTNPTLRKQLLEDFADECDSAAVCLKAAAMPRQGTKVILPLPSLSEKEVYAPQYENGEEVVLIRYPHEGRFQIPRLIVNNNNREGNKRITKTTIDAVGINPKVAEQLSGADFDGDTVVVIPTKGQNIKTDKILAGLKDFDAKERYARPEGTTAPWKKGSETEHKQMGTISNLITDMTLQDAPLDEICRAVKYSQTIIDTGKHNLDYKRAYEENGIAALHEKYQGKASGGAATLISKAKSIAYVPLRDENRISYDPETGEKIYETARDSDRFYTDYRTGKVKEKQTHSTKMAEAKDARELIGMGHPMEEVYADYANHMKALGNDARKTYKQTGDLPYSSEAAKTYATEVKNLKSQLERYEKNAPLERAAQRIANARLRLKKQENPDMTKDEIKKWKQSLLKEARAITGASRYQIEISDKEWEAIQSGALAKTVVGKIFVATDKDKIMARALPRDDRKLSASTISRARSMLRNEATWAEVADALGVSVSALEANIGKV